MIGVQRNDGYCTDANHYPIRESGSLIVTGTIAGVTNQMYQTYNSHRLFIRGSLNTSAEFSNWSEVLISRRIGFRSDYEQTILLLCKVNVNGNLYNRLSGKIYTQYGGSRRYYAADIDFWNSNWVGGSDYRFRLIKYGLVDIDLVKCTYNGEQWYALNFKEDQAVIIYFQGSYENINFTKIIYRNNNTGEVLNSEVYDSIQFLETSIDKVNDTWYATEKYVDDLTKVKFINSGSMDNITQVGEYVVDPSIPNNPCFPYYCWLRVTGLSDIVQEAICYSDLSVKRRSRTNNNWNSWKSFDSFGKTIDISDVSTLLTNVDLRDTAASNLIINVFGNESNFRNVVDNIVENHSKYWFNIVGSNSNLIEVGSVNAYRSAYKSVYEMHFIITYYSGDKQYIKRISFIQNETTYLAKIADLTISDNITTITKKTSAEYASSSKDANTAYFVTD